MKLAGTRKGARRLRTAYEAEEHSIPWWIWVLGLSVLIYLLIPALIVVLTSLNAGTYLTFPPKGLSLKWLLGFFTTADFLPAYFLSLKLAALAGLAAMVVGTLAAVALARGRFPGRAALQSLFLSPLVLPGVVLSFSLLVYYHTLGMIGLRIASTFGGLLIGHIVVTLPYVIRLVSSALYDFDMSLEEAARNLGASPVQAFMKVTVPNISSAMMAGWLFAFIVSFGAFDVSLYLAAPGVTPLPMAMFTYLRWKFDPTPAAAGTWAILLVVVSMVVTSRLTKLNRLAGLD